MHARYLQGTVSTFMFTTDARSDNWQVNEKIAILLNCNIEQHVFLLGLRILWTPFLILLHSAGQYHVTF